MPHQRYIADIAMEIDPQTGLRAYGQVIVLGPRQATGKSELVLSVATHRCIGFAHTGPQRILYTAQTADEAREKWRDIHVARLGKTRAFRDMFHPRLTTNREAMIWRNGSIWSPGSTTGKTSGTGDTLDLGFIDEAWSRPDARTELGMRPAMLTRPWSQLWVLSMIPGLSRALPGTWPYLKRKRDRGRARAEAGVNHGTAFFDFSAPEGMDPGDPATWRLAMPGLGITVSEAKVAEDFEDFDLVDFCAEYLGWEPKETVAKWALIRETTWDGRLDPDSQIAGRPVLAAEISEDRSRGWILAAGRRSDGDIHVEVVEPGYRIPVDAPGVEWVQPRLMEIIEAQDPYAVVIDVRRQATSLLVPLRNAGVKVLTPNQNEIAAACGRFYDATGELRKETLRDPATDEPIVYTGPMLWHTGQPELDRALGQARPLPMPGGSFTFVKRGVSSELGPLYGVVLAMLGEDTLGEDDYDVLDTVDSSRRCVRCGKAIYPRDAGWWHAMDDSPACEEPR